MGGFGGHVLGNRTVTWGAGTRQSADRPAMWGRVARRLLDRVQPDGDAGPRVAGPVTQVFFPAFSRIREPRGFGASGSAPSGLVAADRVPAMLGLIAVAPDFIEVLFGRRWHAAAPSSRSWRPSGRSGASGPELRNPPVDGQTATLSRYTLFFDVVLAIVCVRRRAPLGNRRSGDGICPREPRYRAGLSRAHDTGHRRAGRAWLRASREALLEAAIGMAALPLESASALSIWTCRRREASQSDRAGASRLFATSALLAPESYGDSTT